MLCFVIIINECFTFAMEQLCLKLKRLKCPPVQLHSSVLISCPLYFFYNRRSCVQLPGCPCCPSYRSGHPHAIRKDSGGQQRTTNQRHHLCSEKNIECVVGSKTVFFFFTHAFRKLGPKNHCLSPSHQIINQNGCTKSS